LNGSGSATVAGHDVSKNLAYSTVNGISADGSMTFNALGQQVNLDVSYSASGFSAAGSARVNVLGQTPEPGLQPDRHRYNLGNRHGKYCRKEPGAHV
jgi:hypothetical protein